MHWSTARALRTIARQGHHRLDLELTDALHHDQCRPASATTPDALNLPRTVDAAPRTADNENGRPTPTRASTAPSAGAYSDAESSSNNHSAPAAAKA